MKVVTLFGVALGCSVVQDRHYCANCGLLTVAAAAAAAAAVVAVWLRRRTDSRSWMLEQLVHER